VNPYRQLFQALNDAGIRYLVVGGVAVNLHGYRRFTADVDILLALDTENLEKMTKLMHSLGYIERLPVQLKALTDPELVKKFLEEKGMTAYTFLSNTKERIDIDILAAKSLEYAEYAKNSLQLDIEDSVKVPVIGLNDLIALKKEANRAKDMEDIKILLELKTL
jgi:predicted nucleotidyltransferase